VSEERADEVWEFVRKQVEAGRQAFLVYPVIEGEKDDQPELDFARGERCSESQRGSGKDKAQAAAAEAALGDRDV
jgi:ATP-dependent DNA helicase RecG